MATSGSFNTSSVGSFYFTFAWERTGYSASKNEHYIYYEVVAHNTPGNYRTVYLKNLWINGSQKYYTAGTSGNGKTCYDGTVITSGNMTISGSNDYGDGYITASFEAGVGQYPNANASGEGSWDLNRIPRTTSITSHSISGRTSSSLTVSWNAAHSCDAVQYSLNGGSWQNTSGTTYTLSGLAAATQYSIKTRARRSDTGLWAESGTLYGTTFAKTTPTISLSSKTSTSITVSSGCNVAVSSTWYRIRPSGGDWGAWQASATFTGLKPNTTYIVQVEKRGTDSGEYGYADVRDTTHPQTIPTISLQNTNVQTIIVDSGCNIAVDSTVYRIKRSVDSSYGDWQTSNVFSGLMYNTMYDIQVQKIGTVNKEPGTATLYNVSTLDIARVIDYNSNWNVEEPITFNITNVGNCVMRLYLLYNSVEIIYRNNIEVIDGQYVFNLTTEEKNQLYSLAAGETNPDFKFVLRSYYEGVLVGSDSDKIIAIEFPTKAWTKIDGIWKRALVWGRPTINEPWRQCLPWVDINKNKDWKRI